MRLFIGISTTILLLISGIYRFHDGHVKHKAHVSADNLVAFAISYLGTPYRYGGNTPEGFDCSGFVSFVFAHFNYTLPRSSVDYGPVGVPVSRDSCRKGDIILFSGTNNNLSSIGHIGIVVTNPGESLSFIHASSSKNRRGVIISEFKGTGYVDRFIGIRRLPLCFSPPLSE